MSLFPHELESDRLRFERLHPDDVDPFELYDHVGAGAPGIEEVTTHLDWEPYTQPKQAAERIEEAGAAFDDGEDATYVVRPMDGDHEGAFAGCTGIHPEWDRRRAELWVWLQPSFQGLGYAGERAERFCRLAFERLDLEVVAVRHTVGNEASRRAVESYVERLGGREEGRVRNDTTIDGEPRDVVRYSVSREEWRARLE